MATNDGVIDSNLNFSKPKCGDRGAAIVEPIVEPRGAEIDNSGKNSASCQQPQNQFAGRTMSANPPANLLDKLPTLTDLTVTRDMSSR